MRLEANSDLASAFYYSRCYHFTIHDGVAVSLLPENPWSAAGPAIVRRPCRGRYRSIIDSNQSRLLRRQQGYGRGGRMKDRQDQIRDSSVVCVKVSRSVRRWLWTIENKTGRTGMK